MNYQSVYFEEGEYYLKTIDSYEDRMQSYRLRHEIFCETLAWVPPSADKLEIDRYDSVATTLGLFSSENGKLLGLSRLIPPDHPFMLEAEFSDLLFPEHPLRKEADTAEITRMAISPSVRNQNLSTYYLRLLFKGIYQWSLINAVRYFYLEVEKKFSRVLPLMGFPCTPVGPIVQLPPGNAFALAICMDLEAFRQKNQGRRLEFLNWMTTIESASALSPVQWHDRERRHEVLPEYSEHESLLSAHSH